jgi:hypothetical protein
MAIALDFSSMMIPAVSKFVMIKIGTITALSTIFSPAAIILMLLFSFGVPYLIVKTMFNVRNDKSIKTSDIFRSNKSLISIMFVLSLLINVSYNEATIIKQSTENLKPYSDMCVFIPQKMLESNYSDDRIMDAMEKSGCNPASFAGTKLFWQMAPKPAVKQEQHYLHGQWGWREDLDT